MTETTKQRAQSTIQFPYKDMEVGIGVAQAMLDAGGVALTPEQLAGVLKMQPGTGAFSTKIATAKIFGLLTTVSGKYELTNLGFSIVDKNDKRRGAARAESFLAVPLYKRTYEEFRGKQLPPNKGLEQAFVRFGVAPKQAEVARWAFEKSARLAGFFSAGDDRLIEPIVGAPIMAPAATADEPRSVEPPPAAAPISVQQQASPKSALHPFIQGLLDTLPAPETNWTIEGRAKWLQAAAHCFDLIYMGSGEITIQAKAPHAPPSVPSPAAVPSNPSLRQAAQSAGSGGRPGKPPPDDDIPF